MFAIMDTSDESPDASNPPIAGRNPLIVLPRMPLTVLPSPAVAFVTIDERPVVSLPRGPPGESNSPDALSYTAGSKSPFEMVVASPFSAPERSPPPVNAAISRSGNPLKAFEKTLATVGAVFMSAKSRSVSS
jgi:hypothetical protein